MALESGTRLGPYQIVSPLGAGGMGEVYRAVDTRLDRAVAIKILPSELAHDPERRSRFEREAKAIAALTHPNICTLYDVGNHEGVEFLVMELLEGKTLAARLESGPLPLSEAIACAIQIADALDKSHRQGIVHRDLKPSNVMLTRPRSGTTGPPHVKLLDFGLAKRAEGESVVEGATVAAAITAHGQILGTLHYMAPEQLQGKPADSRSDIFAFGALVYEMVTGRRPFDGSNPASLIGAILHTAAPPMIRSTQGVPPLLDRLVTVCLAKEPEERWSSIHDVLIQLNGIAEGSVEDPLSVPGGGNRGRQRLAWLVASVASVAAIVLAGLLIARIAPRPASEPVLDLLTVLPPSQTSLAYGEAAQISPDGRMVALVAVDKAGKSALYVRARDSVAIHRLPETDGASMPFWSPDNRSLGFFAGGQLKTTALAGGLPRMLAPAPVPRGAAWNRDDLIMYSAIPNAPPMLIPAAGGQPKPAPVETPERGFRSFPAFLPDGRHYLYLTLSAQSGIASSIRVASIDSTHVKQLVATKANAIFASGFLLYRRDTALVAQPFDPDALALSGTPATIVDDVAYDPIAYRALFSVSDTNALVYQPMSGGGKELVWFDRQGVRLGAATPPGEYNRVCFTGDEKQIVYEQADPLSGNVDLWSLDLATNRTTRLTFDPAVDFFPVCSPSAPPEVMFASLRDGPPHLFRQLITAPGSEKDVLRAEMVPMIASDWSRDGQTILYSQLSAKTSWDIWLWPLSGAAPRPVLASPAEERNGKLSPDGRWMAYVSGETARFEVYVQPFPPTGVKWQISRGGGDQPEWRRDGKELYYVAPDRKLIAVDVNAGASGFSPGAARALVETRLTDWDQGPNLGSLYAATADGKRFLLSNQTEVVNPITIMLNWTAARKQ